MSKKKELKKLFKKGFASKKDSHPSTSSKTSSKTLTSMKSSKGSIKSDCSPTQLGKGTSDGKIVDEVDDRTEILKKSSAKACLPKIPNYSRIKLAETHDIAQIPHRGTPDIYPKRVERQSKNVWRKFAVLQFIHRHGGWVLSNKGKKFIPAGTQLPEKPTQNLFSINSDAKHCHCEFKFTYPSECKSSQEVAHKLGLQLSKYMRRKYREHGFIPQSSNETDDESSSSSTSSTSKNKKK